jgi:hypothetical protein
MNPTMAPKMQVIIMCMNDTLANVYNLSRDNVACSYE